MTNKEFCDECGKELEEESFSFCKKTYFWMNFNYKHKDFCSKKCFLKFIDREIRGEDN